MISQIENEEDRQDSQIQSEDDFDPTTLMLVEEEQQEEKEEIRKPSLTQSFRTIFKSNPNNGYSALISPTHLNNQFLEKNNELYLDAKVIKEEEEITSYSNELLKPSDLESVDIDKDENNKEQNEREDNVYTSELNQNYREETVYSPKLNQINRENSNYSPNLNLAEIEEGVNSIYLDNLDNKSKLEQKILPEKKNSSRLKEGFAFLGQKQKFKDIPFLLLYLFIVLLFLIINTVVLVKSSGSSLISKYASTTIFRAIKESLLAVSINIIISISIGSLWLYGIILLTKNVIWFIFLGMPAISVLTSIWMITKGSIGFSFIYGDGNPSLESKLLAIIPFLVAIIHGFIIHQYHSSVKQAIDIVQMTSNMLKNNVEIFAVSLMCLGLHILFSAIWLISFDRLFLLGHLEDGDNNDKSWVLNPDINFLVPFYLFFYWWTSSLINNVERCCIAGTVSQWYFHKEQHQFLNGYYPTRVALKRAVTTSFGSLSFAALIMSFVKALRAIKYAYIKAPKAYGKYGKVIRVMFIPILAIANIVESISFFTVSYIGISGKSFLQSSKLATYILSKKFSKAMIATFIIRTTIYSAIFIGSTISGFAFFCFSADSLHTSHFLIVGSIGLGIPLFIFKFLMNVLLYSADAIFICYGIDLDQQTIHDGLAHKVLSNNS